MTQITVSDDLARQILGASAPILIVNQNGKALGQFVPLTQSGLGAPSGEDFGEIERRMASDDGTRHTWGEVKELLHSLARE
jgi:hypothetical protein